MAQLAAAPAHDEQDAVWYADRHVMKMLHSTEFIIPFGTSDASWRNFVHENPQKRFELNAHEVHALLEAAFLAGSKSKE